MAEAAAKAIQEWVEQGSPSDILAFCKSFFSVPQAVEEPVTEKKTEKKEKGKKCSARTVKGKACSKCAKTGEVFCASHLPNRAELEPSDAKTEEEKTAGKKTRKCCAVTAKGARCSKNAKEGCDKCAIHSKDKVEKKEVKKTEAKKKSESRGSVVVLESLVEGDEEEEEGEVVSMVKISDMSLEEESEDDNSVVVDEEEFDE